MSKKRSDKRVVTTDALETLGTIHKKMERRDAIHLAVEPVEAGERLEPGERIGVVNGIAYGEDNGTTLGIVDPFLTAPVLKGQRFWFIMDPGKVHSLRHVWAHPAFPDAPELVADGAVQGTKRVLNRAVERAKAHIQNVADELDLSYDELIEHAEDYLKRGNYYIGGSEAEGYCVEEDFWKDYELATGREVPEDRRNNFISCSC